MRAEKRSPQITSDFSFCVFPFFFPMTFKKKKSSQPCWYVDLVIISFSPQADRFSLWIFSSNRIQSVLYSFVSPDSSI